MNLRDKQPKDPHKLIKILIFSSSTIIIDIVTTRFNEAYTYMTDNNANNLKPENTYEDISKIKRFNQESSLLKGKLIRTKSLDEKDVGRYTQSTVESLTCNDCAKTNNVVRL